MRARIADYAGLTFEPPADPVGMDPAIVHTAAFRDGLEAQVAEWMMFDQGGEPLVDPVLGYTVTESAPDDLHFADEATPSRTSRCRRRPARWTVTPTRSPTTGSSSAGAG